MSWTDKVGASPSEASSETPAQSGKKANLPQVLEQTFDDTTPEDIIALLEEGVKIKETVGVKPDPKKNTVGSGLLKREYDIKEQLGVIAATHGLEGFRHNSICYTQRLQDGKETFSLAKFIQFLVGRGVAITTINEGVKECTSTGEGFYVREISVLKKK